MGSRNTWIVRGLVVGLALMSGACGGGDDGGAPPTSPPLTGNITVNAAGSPGDLITYTLDFDALTYTYQVVAGNQIQPPNGAGTLTHLPQFGSGVYQTDTGATVLVLPNSLVLVRTAAGELIAGVPALTTTYTLADIQGTYNFVSWTASGFGWGTFDVQAGTYSVWEATNQQGAPDEQGSWSDQGNGVIRAWSNGTEPNPDHNVMILPSGNESVLVIDNTAVSGDPGLTVGVKQRPLPVISSAFRVLETGCTASYEVGVTHPGMVVGPVDCNDPGAGVGARTYVLDTPWSGMAQSNDFGETNYALLSPSGIVFGGGFDAFEDWFFFALTP